MTKIDRPKVAIALNMLSPYWYDVFENLSKNWEVMIFIGTQNEPNRSYKVPDFTKYGFTVNESRNVLFNLSSFGFKTKYLHLQWGLWSDLVSFRPHVILVNELGPRALIAMTYGRLFSIPVVPWVCASKHTERNNSRLREGLRRLLLKNAPSVCTNLFEAKEYLMDRLQVPEERIFATPYVVDVAKFNSFVNGAREEGQQLRKKLGLRGRVMLYVGQMIERKGLRQFIDSLDWLDGSEHQFSLLLVGGILGMDIQDTLRRRGVCYANIPFVQREELYAYYAAADAFIFPTLEDEWGIVLNEAAAAGLPLLASKYAAATTDLVRDEVNGKIFDSLDKQSIQGAVRAMLSIPNTELAQWGINSLAQVKEIDIDFTVNNMRASLCNALRNQKHKG